MAKRPAAALAEAASARGVTERLRLGCRSGEGDRCRCAQPVLRDVGRRALGDVWDGSAQRPVDLDQLSPRPAVPPVPLLRPSITDSGPVVSLERVRAPGQHAIGNVLRLAGLADRYRRFGGPSDRRDVPARRQLVQVGVSVTPRSPSSPGIVARPAHSSAIDFANSRTTPLVTLSPARFGDPRIPATDDIITYRARRTTHRRRTILTVRDTPSTFTAVWRRQSASDISIADP